MNPNDLHDLFDEAAGTFSPQPDVGRFTTLLQGSGRGRPALFGIGAVAAAVLITVGGAAALSGRMSDEPVSPGELYAHHGHHRARHDRRGPRDDDVCRTDRDDPAA